MTHPYMNSSVDSAEKISKQAGYTEEDKVKLALESTRAELLETLKSIKSEARILDIGCGPGQFLQLMPEEADLHGIDISEAMIREANKNVPNAQYQVGDFLKLDFQKESFDLIYCIGAIIYFTKSEMKDVLLKIDSLLKPGATALISYPHAISKMDLWYNDYTYVQYSPKMLEKLLPKQLEVISHHHSVSKEKIVDYDRKAFIDPNKYKGRNYFNSSILTLKKKID